MEHGQSNLPRDRAGGQPAAGPRASCRGFPPICDLQVGAGCRRSGTTSVTGSRVDHVGVRQRGPEVTLGTTTLLHEAYLNISEREGLHFADRAHFLAYASRAMRGLMIDYVRRRRAKKRGSEFQLTGTLDQAGDGSDAPAAEPLERLGDALDTLGGVDPTLAQLVDLHFFCGLSFGEIASLREVSERTVQRDWRKARLLLHRTLQEP